MTDKRKRVPIIQTGMYFRTSKGRAYSLDVRRKSPIGIKRERGFDQPPKGNSNG